MEKNPKNLLFIIRRVFMKRHLLSFSLIILSLITGCSKGEKVENSDTSTSFSINFDYEMVEHLSIEWDQVLSQEEDNYYVYIYSKTCGHCREIKNEVIGYALAKKEKMYFIEYSEVVPKITQKEEVLGATDITYCGVIGVPSLFEIKEHKIINYYLGAKEIIEILEKVFSTIENYDSI